VKNPNQGIGRTGRIHFIACMVCRVFIARTVIPKYSCPKKTNFAIRYPRIMAKEILLRKLGRSGLSVTPIGLGCWQFSQRNNLAGKFWPSLENNVINDIVKASLEGGVNWFDTAEVYGQGASEKALARSLELNGKKPGEVIVATKWWPMFRTASNIPRTIGDRLACLHPYPIDLYQVHQPWGFSSEVKEMEAMAGLVKAGNIRHVGVSNFNAARMRRAWETLDKAGIPLVSNQVQYSLLHREIESNGVMETAKELGITIIAYSPLAQGLVTGKFHDNPELLKNIGLRKYSSLFKPQGLAKSKPVAEAVKNLARKYGVTPSQVALNWLINFHGESVVAIPGATKASHAAENTVAMKFTLSPDDMILLDRVSRGFKTGK
jgi:aryl-alcohol dehydrogenase-like predicted oxidoreductase